MTAFAKTHRDHFDVLVVGARCAGAATAMLLARRGLNVLAVDRGEYGADTISTHALMRGAVMQLVRWGLMDAVKASGAQRIERAVFHYGDEAEPVAIRPGPGFDGLYAPRRTELDRILVDAARLAGAEVRFGCTLDTLVHGPDGRVTGAMLRGRDGALTEVSAGIVIGADGVRSRVAQLVGAKTLVQGTSATAVLYGHFAGLPNDGYHFLYRPGLTAGVIPTNAGESCVFVGAPSGQRRGTGGGGEALFHHGLAVISPSLAEAVADAPPVKLRAFAGIPGHLRQAQGPGWALVGDAAYFKDPITAHGITDAFRDAELLARAVASGTRQAMEDYQHLRDALSLPLLNVTDRIASFEWSPDGLKPMLKTLSEAMQTEVTVLASIAQATPLPPMRPDLPDGLALAG